MSTKSPGPQRCRLILQQCLAIQLSKAGNAPEDFWMYDSGYMIFQVSFVVDAYCFAITLCKLNEAIKCMAIIKFEIIKQSLLRNNFLQSTLLASVIDSKQQIGFCG
jgi:hypothetical protein